MSRPPSVVLVCVDSLRADALGAEGDLRSRARYGVRRPARTPTLDALAREGVRFSRAYTTAPHTPPAHAALFTGLPPVAHGVRTAFSRPLARAATTIAERLRARGYATVACHEELFGPYFRHLDLLRGMDRVVGGDEEAAIRACASGPAFLFVHVGDVHHPYGRTEAPAAAGENDDFDARFARLREEFPARPRGGPGGPTGLAFDYEAVKREALRRGRADRVFEEYLFGVEKCDAGRLRRLFARLEGAGLLDDGIAVLFADHGEMLYPWGFAHGGHLAEEILRVPLLVRAPARAPAGRVVDGLASLADLPATILDLLGIEVEPPPEGAGRSLRPLWEGREDPAGRRAYSEIWIEDLGAALERLRQSRRSGALPAGVSETFLYERAWRRPGSKYLLAGLSDGERQATPPPAPDA
ncbi:MAG: sulfatase, partial [Planctomycetales bacterium]|nr:sulfatase [Planctomycetales bacterium]